MAKYKVGDIVQYEQDKTTRIYKITGFTTRDEFVTDVDILANPNTKIPRDLYKVRLIRCYPISNATLVKYFTRISVETLDKLAVKLDSSAAEVLYDADINDIAVSD